MLYRSLESFVIGAAAESPRSLRINAVSPNVLANSPHFHDLFPGQRPVNDEEVGRAFVLSVEGLVSGRTITVRSEEHTSELQSRGHLVCRLLLEKKKKRQQYNT